MHILFLNITLALRTDFFKGIISDVLSQDFLNKQGQFFWVKSQDCIYMNLMSSQSGLPVCSVCYLKTTGLMTFAKTQLIFWVGNRARSMENENRIAPPLLYLHSQFHPSDLMEAHSGSVRTPIYLQLEIGACQNLLSDPLFIVDVSIFSFSFSFSST